MIGLHKSIRQIEQIRIWTESLIPERVRADRRARQHR
jgi:hypothetical protein